MASPSPPLPPSQTPSLPDEPEEARSGTSSDLGAILQTAYTSGGAGTGMRTPRDSRDEPGPSQDGLAVDDGATTAPASPRGQLFADDSSTDEDDEAAGVVPDPSAQVMGPLYVDTSLPGRYRVQLPLVL